MIEPLPRVEVYQEFKNESKTANQRPFTLAVLGTRSTFQSSSCAIPQVRKCIDQVKNLTLWIKASAK